MRDPQDLVQTDQFPLPVGHRNPRRLKAFTVPIGHQGQTDPLVRRLPPADVHDPQEFLLIIMADRLDHLIQVNLQLFQLMGIIDQLPLHRCRTLHIDPVDAGNTAQSWLNPLLRITLDKDGRGRRVQGITQEWPVLLLVGTTGRDDRIRHILGQARPGLPDNGRCLKASHVNIGVAIQLHRDFPITIPRGRGHPADATDPRQHGL